MYIQDDQKLSDKILKDSRGNQNKHFFMECVSGNDKLGRWCKLWQTIRSESTGYRYHFPAGS